MENDRVARARAQLLDGGEILTCTFETMDVLQRAVAMELGEDEADRYGLSSRTQVRVLGTAERPAADRAVDE